MLLIGLLPIVCSVCLRKWIYIAQAHLLRNGATHSGLSPPTPTMNQENGFPTGQSDEAIPQLRFPLPRCPCQADKTQPG